MMLMMMSVVPIMDVMHGDCMMLMMVYII